MRIIIEKLTLWCCLAIRSLMRVLPLWFLTAMLNEDIR